MTTAEARTIGQKSAHSHKYIHTALMKEYPVGSTIFSVYTSTFDCEMEKKMYTLAGYFYGR